MFGTGHYDYVGSLTTPPCTEQVQWVVQAVQVSVKQSQIDAFWNHIGAYPGNARNLQPLNGRTIAFNVDNHKDGKNKSRASLGIRSLEIIVVCFVFFCGILFGALAFTCYRGRMINVRRSHVDQQDNIIPLLPRYIISQESNSSV